MRISRKAYPALYGPTAGDRVRLGDTDLILEIERDLTTYDPGLLIHFPGSEFVQAVDVTLTPEAKFGMLELWAIGRIERGEYLAFSRLSSRARVVLDNHPCYLDALELRPDRSHLAGWGVLEVHRYVATGYWHWDAAGDAAALAGDIAEPGLLLVSGVPSPGGLYIRGLARDGLALGAALSTFLRRQRAAWGLSPIPFERYSGVFDRAMPSRTG